MKICGCLALLIAVSACVLAFAPPQIDRDPERSRPPSEVRLPNGKLQQDEILKSDHEKTIRDAAQLIEMAESLKKDLEKDDSHVLSISTLKKTEEIEKLAKRIRSRLKRL
jgi:hypothetical protein